MRFLLGGGQVVEGVDGERRKLVVPPKLGKRSEYSEGLSPDATLQYDIELVGLVPDE